MTHRLTIELPAGTFSYLERGEGDPIVFLHALGRSASDWLPVLDLLDNEYRCLALDQRGHGESVRPGEYSFELLEQDLRSFVETLDLARFVLVAHSMGGTVAWLYAGATPDQLSALIIEDSPVPAVHHSYPEVDQVPPEPVDYDWEARRQLFRQLNTPEASRQANVPRITTPTLVIDGSGFEDLRDTVRILPHGQLISLEVGHWIHESVSTVFAQSIRDFLAKLTP